MFYNIGDKQLFYWPIPVKQDVTIYQRENADIVIKRTKLGIMIFD